MIQDTLFSIRAVSPINTGGIERVKGMHIYVCNVILFYIIVTIRGAGMA